MTVISPAVLGLAAAATLTLAACSSGHQHARRPHHPSAGGTPRHSTATA